MGTIEHRYDAAGNLTSSTDGSHSLRFAYDIHSRLSSFTDKFGNITLYTYYPNSLLKSVQYLAQSVTDTVTVTYAYNADRSLKSVIGVR
jgi:YD repeat-containing protein